MDGMSYFDGFPFTTAPGSESSASESSYDFLLQEDDLVDCMSPLLKREDYMNELLLHGSTNAASSSSAAAALVPTASSFSNSTSNARSTRKPKSKVKLAAEAKRAKSAQQQKRDLEIRRRHSHTSKEPTRDEFPDEATYIDTWRKWRQIRDNNNAAVKKSRENLKKKKMETETLCEKREKMHAGLEYEISLLREHVQLLIRAVRDAPSLDDGERKKVQTLCYEETALVA